MLKISVVSQDGKEIALNLLGAGEIFGEIALLDGGPRTADAIALDDCELLMLDRRDILPLLMEEPSVARRHVILLLLLPHPPSSFDYRDRC